MTEYKTCAITGHRFASLPFGSNENDERCRRLKTVIRSKLTALIETEDVANFLCGMALGSDQIVCEILIQLKFLYPHIRLIAYMPCREQYLRWSAAQIARYRYLLLHADEIIQTTEQYSKGCMHLRNHAMVDAADFLLAVHRKGTRGGTASTVAYAKKRNLPIVEIDPANV